MPFTNLVLVNQDLPYFVQEIGLVSGYGETKRQKGSISHRIWTFSESRREIPRLPRARPRNAVGRTIGPIRRQRKNDFIDRYSGVLALIFIPMGRKKFDPVSFAAGFINLPPTNVWHMDPISLSHSEGVPDILTHSYAITRIQTISFGTVFGRMTFPRILLEYFVALGRRNNRDRQALYDLIGNNCSLCGASKCESNQ
jgi:hypothetical protein